jgi:hypothetical protein
MSCQICENNIAIQQKVDFHNAYLTCEECGNSYTVSVIGIYVGMEGGIHVFHFDEPHYCLCCGSRNLTLTHPCGGHYYFDFSNIKKHNNKY